MKKKTNPVSASIEYPVKSESIQIESNNSNTNGYKPVMDAIDIPLWGIKVNRNSPGGLNVYWWTDSNEVVFSTIYSSLAVVQCEHLNRVFGSTDTQYKMERIQ